MDIIEDEEVQAMYHHTFSGNIAGGVAADAKGEEEHDEAEQQSADDMSIMSYFSDLFDTEELGNAGGTAFTDDD